jgi:hypothetical protein
MEVQFLCAYDIRPNFNVTDTFASFFRDAINKLYSNNTGDDKTSPSSSSDSNSSSTYKGVEKGNDDGLLLLSKNDFDLYSAISVNSIADVNTKRWYYPLCNLSSPEILVTMDVRGFVMSQKQQQQESQQANDKDSTNNNQNNRNELMNKLVAQLDQDQIRSYFEEHVCHQIDFFRAKAVEWNDAWYPLPLNSQQHVQDYQQSIHQQQSQYSSASSASTNAQYQEMHHRHYYEHNLYLLCGGTDDVYFESDGEGPDGAFMVLAVLVGFAMVSMICTELSQFGSGSNRQRGGRRNDGYGYPPIELEMV